ncbi:hypothetical protein BDV24DRAFT_133342 [Aspergillus arachidicola]|uniref:NADH:flavin oxidoreductase/NADH oxidase N-terminal domain-containing protein n=1 Tax=Aspergillus arachidicola TaxID=656916 RepID=A0A5N6Y5N4_9EURO|nr:hypothetical protein BDV24DRAFT_133342 [Aspergillus arachidicola]
MVTPPGLNGLSAPVPNIGYFTPQHQQSPGTPVTLDGSTPTLFTPLNIRSVTLRNRITVAPMCQFSTAPEGASIGSLTNYHIATLGHFALKGAALVFVEATAVQFNGRISPYCPGLWDDAQINGLRQVSTFVKSQGALAGVQLAHAGRKASTAPPWVAGSTQLKKGSLRVGKEHYGWPDEVVGPSGGMEQTWDGLGLTKEGGFWPPRALSLVDIQKLVADWGHAARRAVQAGVDVIEIHAAHGYLIHEFLSPVTNHRTDAYGGSFENRVRLLLEIIQSMRKEMPTGMPLFLRLSSTEWLEDTAVGARYGTWTVEDTIRLAKLVSYLGVDLLDVSSGGNHPAQTVSPFMTRDYQTNIAARIRKALRQCGSNLLVGAVGMITEAEQARDLVDTRAGGEPSADLLLIGRQFLREPEWVLRVAWKLGLDVSWPNQYLRTRFVSL